VVIVDEGGHRRERERERERVKKWHSEKNWRYSPGEGGGVDLRSPLACECISRVDRTLHRGSSKEDTLDARRARSLILRISSGLVWKLLR